VTYYPSTVAFRSKFEPERLFESSEAARAFDREAAAKQLGARLEADFARALAEGDDTIRALVDFLREEMPILARERAA
jgi:hypothetical protein